jgi:NAD dependent epimerase/dehydratase family enzyme
MICWPMDKEDVSGIYNAVAPTMNSLSEIVKNCAKENGYRIYLPNIPEAILKIIFGKRHHLILSDQRISPEKIIDSGFTFAYPDQKAALHQVFHK